MNDYEKTNLLVQVSKLYYENDIGQKEISQRLKISRSYVSKLLIEARRTGIVKIYINDSLEAESEIEQLVRSRFHLKKAIIVPNETHETSKLMDFVGSALSRYLYNIVQDGDIIGISWGMTLQIASQKLIKKSLSKGTVTQLYGGMPNMNTRASISEIVTRFAKAFNFEPYFLLIPAIVDSNEIRDMVIKDKSVAQALDLAKRSRIAVYSIGSFGMQSSLVKAGYFTPGEVVDLNNMGVVGDACARLFDIDGNVVDSKFNNRTVGIELEELKDKEYSILVSVGEKKTRPIYGILSGGYANVLITDESVARGLLDM